MDPNGPKWLKMVTTMRNFHENGTNRMSEFFLTKYNSQHQQEVSSKPKPFVAVIWLILVVRWQKNSKSNRLRLLYIAISCLPGETKIPDDLCQTIPPSRGFILSASTAFQLNSFRRYQQNHGTKLQKKAQKATTTTDKVCRIFSSLLQNPRIIWV